MTGDETAGPAQPADPAQTTGPAPTAQPDSAVPGPESPADAGAPPPRRRRSRLILLSATGLAALAAVGVLTANAAGSSAAPHRPQALKAAKPFSLGELGKSGSHVSLAGFAGQPVIVNFFASWCAPCKKETPLLASFYAAHHGQVRIIGIDSNDQTAAAKKFVKAEGVTYPIGVDPFPARTAVSYDVLALPQTFFLNARHQIVRHVAGDVTSKELDSWAAKIAR